MEGWRGSKGDSDEGKKERKRAGDEGRVGEVLMEGSG